MCKLCETNSVYEFTNQRKLCKNCFIRYFQKKVLYTLRKFKMIQQGDVVYCDNFVLKEVFSVLHNKGIIELANNKQKANKIALGDNLSTESDKIVREIIKGNLGKLKISPADKKVIKPLFLFLEEEIELYSKLRAIKYNKTKSTEDKITKFINDLEKKHPEIKRAIVNSYLELEN